MQAVHLDGGQSTLAIRYDDGELDVKSMQYRVYVAAHETLLQYVTDMWTVNTTSAPQQQLQCNFHLVSSNTLPRSILLHMNVFHAYSAPHLILRQADNPGTCPICMEDTSLLMPVCGHQFCQRCIDLQRAHGLYTCGLCRAHVFPARILPRGQLQEVISSHLVEEQIHTVGTLSWMWYSS